MEFVEIWRAPSAAWIVEASEGRMTRIGADHRAKNRLSDLRSLAPKDEGLLVVMGNEETGLSGEVKASCDHLVRIPGSGDIESLNVAQAATLFLYEISLIG
jgi:TrmH RNA methyltransferase